MPFPIVWGIPSETPKGKLLELRVAIVKTLVETMNVPAIWVRPLFPKDLLDEEAVDETEGCNTIYVSLDTAMFFGKPDVDELAKAVTAALADIVWKVFGGKFEVEVFIGNLNPAWKTLLKAKT